MATLRKWLALLTALLFLPCLTGLAEEDIINRISDPSIHFAFPEGTVLLEVYFPKINGCDAALIRYGEYSMLLDCGGNQWRETDAMLRKLGVTELTYALNSHPDADHIGGFNHVLKTIPAWEFLLGFPEDYEEGDELRFKVYSDLHELGVPFRQVTEGSEIAFGDVKISVHQALASHLERVNNKSVVVRFQLGERSILFPGDIQHDGQKCFVAAQTPLQSDIMKAPHHGYRRLDANYLALVSPRLVVVTSGSNDAECVPQLKENKIKYHYTEQGILHLATDGKVWLVEHIK